MDQRLFEASITGNVEALEALLKKDPHILIKASVFSSSAENNPLHVAALAGHIDFVRQILLWMPSSAQEQNKDGFSPIHLATAAGHLEVVKELLEKGGILLCLLKDKEGRTPLHLASISGRVQIIEEMLSRCPKALDEVTAIGETALLLAVKGFKVEAFKVLFEKSMKLEKHEERMNAKDDEGNSILDLAKTTNQLQVTELLEQNHQAITVGNYPGDNAQQPAGTNNKWTLKAGFAGYKESWCKFYDQEKVVAIVAGLIVQTTYQAAVNPPPSIWKEGIDLDTKCLKSVLNPFFQDRVDYFRSCPAYGYYMFMLFVVVAFTTSILVIPFHGNNWITITLFSTSLFSMLMTVLYSVGATSSSYAFYQLLSALVLVAILSLINMPAIVVLLNGCKFGLRLFKGGGRRNYLRSFSLLKRR